MSTITIDAVMQAAATIVAAKIASAAARGQRALTYDEIAVEMAHAMKATRGGLAATTVLNGIPRADI